MTLTGDRKKSHTAALALRERLEAAQKAALAKASFMVGSVVQVSVGSNGSGASTESGHPTEPVRIGFLGAASGKATGYGSTTPYGYPLPSLQSAAIGFSTPPSPDQDREKRLVVATRPNTVHFDTSSSRHTLAAATGSSMLLREPSSDAGGKHPQALRHDLPTQQAPAADAASLTAFVPYMGRETLDAPSSFSAAGAALAAASAAGVDHSAPPPPPANSLFSLAPQTQPLLPMPSSLSSSLGPFQPFSPGITAASVHGVEMLRPLNLGFEMPGSVESNAILAATARASLTSSSKREALVRVSQQAKTEVEKAKRQAAERRGPAERKMLLDEAAQKRAEADARCTELQRRNESLKMHMTLMMDRMRMAAEKQGAAAGMSQRASGDRGVQYLEQLLAGVRGQQGELAVMKLAAEEPAHLHSYIETLSVPVRCTADDLHAVRNSLQSAQTETAAQGEDSKYAVSTLEQLISDTEKATNADLRRSDEENQRLRDVFETASAHVTQLTREDITLHGSNSKIELARFRTESALQETLLKERVEEEKRVRELKIKLQADFDDLQGTVDKQRDAEGAHAVALEAEVRALEGAAEARNGDLNAALQSELNAARAHAALEAERMGQTLIARAQAEAAAAVEAIRGSAHSRFQEVVDEASRQVSEEFDAITAALEERSAVNADRLARVREQLAIVNSQLMAVRRVHAAHATKLAPGGPNALSAKAPTPEEIQLHSLKLTVRKLWTMQTQSLPEGAKSLDASHPGSTESRKRFLTDAIRSSPYNGAMHALLKTQMTSLQEASQKQRAAQSARREALRAFADAAHKLSAVTAASSGVAAATMSAEPTVASFFPASPRSHLAQVITSTMPTSGAGAASFGSPLAGSAKPGSPQQPIISPASVQRLLNSVKQSVSTMRTLFEDTLDEAGPPRSSASPLVNGDGLTRSLFSTQDSLNSSHGQTQLQHQQQQQQQPSLFSPSMQLLGEMARMPVSVLMSPPPVPTANKDNSSTDDFDMNSLPDPEDVIRRALAMSAPKRAAEPATRSVPQTRAIFRSTSPPARRPPSTFDIVVRASSPSQGDDAASIAARFSPRTADLAARGRRK
jgi:hypothetical protein